MMSVMMDVMDECDMMEMRKRMRGKEPIGGFMIEMIDMIVTKPRTDACYPSKVPGGKERLRRSP